MRRADINACGISLKRKYRSYARAAETLGIPYKRLCRLCGNQQVPRPDEIEVITQDLGFDPFDAGQRYRDEDRAAQARLLKVLATGEGLALVRRLRQILSPEEI